MTDGEATYQLPRQPTITRAMTIEQAVKLHYTTSVMSLAGKEREREEHNYNSEPLYTIFST